MQVQGKTFSVIGLGRSGIAVANFLVKKGARVIVFEQHPREEMRASMIALQPEVSIQFGSCTPDENSDCIVLSPGVDIHSEFLDSARHQGVEIISELELAFRFSSSPIIAVTGTNGKSTCTTLIGKIFQEAQKNILVGGNIGTPFISLIEKKPADQIVLEVSSFQLEAIDRFHPQVAIVLNITPDHLDRHGDMAHYTQLKEKIATNQSPEDVLVLNQDDPATRDLAKDKPPRRIFFSTTREVEQGACIINNKIVTRLEGKEQTVCEVGDLQKNMAWQLETVLAATIVATLMGIDAKSIASSIRSFGGLEHRMEWVRNFRGIDFVNDSKGTNIGAVRRSLENFTRPVILIAGGRDKDSDFSELKNIMKAKVKHLVLIGEARSKFKSVLNGSFKYEEADSMNDAVQLACANAASGDVVLLSPACSSFDMFKSYEDRGDQFKKIVRDL
jgi:UDP-N-acetylmuramoylalanine--D-glutamate ligase